MIDEETAEARTKSRRPAPSRFATGLVLLVASAHFVHDLFTALVAPLLPLLIDKLDLSLTRAGSLTVLLNLPSLFNPYLGALTDRYGLRRWFVVLGPGLTGTLLTLVGLAPSYVAAAVLLFATGVSVAMLHVAAPVVIARLAADRVGRGMSFFMVAGELARTVGPLVAVELVARLSLEGLWRVAPVAWAASLLLGSRLARLDEPAPTGRRAGGLLVVWRELRRILLGVGGILLARGFLVGGLSTFLPTFLYREGSSLLYANVSLAVFELAGAAGALTSGTVSDWVGRRTILATALVLSPPLMLAFLHTSGSGRLVVLVLLGFVALSTAPVLMAVVIENAGTNAAAANGTYFMVGFAIRGVVTLLVGLLGDWVGLRQAYGWCALLAVGGLPFLRLLPATRGGRGG